MLDYCAALEAHNDRTWFHENHAWYDKARADYARLLEMLRFTIAGSAPALSDDILYMSVKDWTYRIARDMRYYKDKPPYNPSFRAYISSDRKSWLPIGYFLRIAPGSSCFGTGIWLEDTSSMNIIRDFICARFEEFSSTLTDNGLEITGSKLKTVPRGYSPEDPAADLIRFKNWAVIEDISDSRLTTFEDFEALVRSLVERMEPFRLLLLDAARSGRTYKSELENFYNAGQSR